MKLRRYALVLVLLLALAAPALGQGCSMCASTAGATGEKGRKTFVRAVAVLLFPTLAMGIFIVGAAFRYRNRNDQQDS
jgi:hypothetical protein